jgi:hypothetical protein
VVYPPGRVAAPSLNVSVHCPACDKFHLRPRILEGLGDLTKIDWQPPVPIAAYPLERGGFGLAIDLRPVGDVMHALHRYAAALRVERDRRELPAWHAPRPGRS